jgi:hypothetical protein
MANTFELIASSTVGSGGAASIDFTSIPSTFTDLCVKLSGRSTATPANPWTSVYSYFNNDTTGGNYTGRAVYGTGSAAGSEANGVVLFASNGTATASTFANSELYIPNYTSSNAKSASADNGTESNATASLAYLGALLWSGTAAINRITLTPTSGNFAQYSTAYLYGVKNA